MNRVEYPLHNNKDFVEGLAAAESDSLILQLHKKLNKNLKRYKAALKKRNAEALT